MAALETRLGELCPRLHQRFFMVRTQIGIALRLVARRTRAGPYEVFAFACDYSIRNSKLRGRRADRSPRRARIRDVGPSTREDYGQQGGHDERAYHEQSVSHARSLVLKFSAQAPPRPAETALLPDRALREVAGFGVRVQGVDFSF